MKPHSITVYSFRRCPFAMRVRIALYEKGIEFSVQEEDLKNLSPTLRALHPEARVPLLVHGEKVIYESAIIVEYVDDLSAENPLMPLGAADRADVRLWTYWCNRFFKADLDRFKYGVHRFTEAECVGAEERLTAHLQKLETRLGEAKWLVGGVFSLADINVFPFVRQLFRIQPRPALLDRFPQTLQWLEKISNRPSFALAMGISTGN